MLLFWSIRYIDTSDKQFKDRCLWLDTDILDDLTRASFELDYELKDINPKREMLKYRHLFSETKPFVDDSKSLHSNFGSILIVDYFEDENGNEISDKKIAEILTGNSNSIMFPSHSRQHDIEYALSEKQPILISEIVLSKEQIEILGYFTRDLKEIMQSSFYREGPGTLKQSGGNTTLSTAVSDEEIRSFVTVFRRLYMEKEPANFMNAVAVFSEQFNEYPLGKWIKKEADEYLSSLSDSAQLIPLPGNIKCTFSRKRIIDIFIYTQYSHQPNERRSRQFRKCLFEVGDNQPTLMWLFLTALSSCNSHIINAGRIIADFYDRYLECHEIPSGILDSIANNNLEIGILEKRSDRKSRVFREKAEELAMVIWKESGRPEGGPMQFISKAREKLQQCR